MRISSSSGRGWSILLLLAAGCGGGSSSLVPPGKTASATIGASGGDLATSDGALQVAIPAGALPSNVMVTVAPTTSPGSGSIGTVYEIGPTGTQFTTPITLTLQYDPAKLGGTDPSMLRVATYASGSWQMLPGAKVDTQAKTVSGTTTHLSPYTLVSAATGAICASVRGGTQCTVSGGDTNGSGGPVSSSCTTSTCAEATNACSGYPGAKLSGCVDSSDGYTATCCFDPGAPICFSAGGGAAICASGGGTGGQTVTCPPPPTCASATAATTCGGFPGATVRNCTDTGSGYTAACCFDPGAPVCISVGAGAGCADSGGTNAGFTCPPPPSCATSNPCANNAGTTLKSCTDTSNGYTAVCCYAPGQLPPTGGSASAGGTKGVDAGVPVSGGGGGTDPGTGGGSPGGLDAGQPPNPGKDAGVIYPPPPAPDSGSVPPPQKDAGVPVPPPPQADAGTQPCQVMMQPPSTTGAPCAAGEFCPSNGNMWQVKCQQGGICTCIANGKQTMTVNASCDPYDWSALMTACGFPAQ